MDAYIDPALIPRLWIGWSLALGATAAHLCFAWLARTPSNDLGARLRRLLGAGISLGTGIWSAHAIGASIDPAGVSAGYDLGTEFAVWLLAVAASMTVFGWSDTRSAARQAWLPAACSVGTAIAIVQVLGMAASGWQPGIDWRVAGQLLLAWLCCLAGSVAAFGLLRSLRGKHSRMQMLGGLGASVGLSAGVVAGQHLLGLAADLPMQSASALVERMSAGALTALGSLASLGLLLISHVLLGRHERELAARLQARRVLGAQSLNDPLTGLPNRSLFEGTLTQAVQQADAGQLRLALLFINLDRFQPINQSSGHHAGDQLLCEVAKRLRSLSQPHMTARLAGDEFLVLLTGNPQPEAASALAASLLDAIGRPFTVDGRDTSMSCSIGVAMYPEHGAMSTLIDHADNAMRAAKMAGGASHAFFEARMVKGTRDQMDLLRDLRVALERGQLELYYQPKIHAPSGEITGAEALIRWHHPQRGMVSPAVFIPIAERYGLIGALGQWVIEEACRQTRAWRDGGLRMRVAINLSVHQLRQADLADRIGAALARHQVNPDLLTCELTESSAMDDTEVTMRVLGQLAVVGVHISIDDFGTGHSSLSYLRKLPAKELKIDRSFVMDLETSEDARKIASAVINLAKALDLQVVAEGVETEAQNRILREFGCDQLQGYLFARPMSAKALALWAMDDVGPRTMNFRESLFKATMPAPAG